MNKQFVNLVSLLFLIAISLVYPLPGEATVNVRMQTVMGDIDVELFDDVAPLTVANFVNYVRDGDYDRTFIHRSMPGFVIQGGGYTFENDTVTPVPKDPPVLNEFSLSNLRGTIAMAKSPDLPNSATSEWFFNLDDNSENLDNQNGGFTVFGRVLGNGMEIVDAIAGLTWWNVGGAFTNLPLIDFPGTGDIQEVHLVMISRVIELANVANDIMIDFGASGIWVRYNNASWSKLHPSNPDGMAAGDMDGSGQDEAIIDFGSSGTWVRYNDTSWSKLHPSNPDGMATGDMDGGGNDEVIIDFGSSGIWARMNDTSWAKLHPSDPDSITTGDMDGDGQDDVVLDFGSSGIWVRMNDTSWTKLHPSDPDSIATGDMDNNGQDEVIIDFGSSGVWVRMNNTSWVKLHPSNPDGIYTGDMDGNGLDEVIIDFGTSGIWVRVNNASWVKLHPSNPDSIATGDMDSSGQDEVIIDFGSSGVWVRMNNSSWIQLHPSDPDSIASGNFDGN